MSEQNFGHIPRIGEEAPDFNANTTHGPINFRDWQGDSWVVLFSHPADFTPVCSTELSEFARRGDEFAKRNVKLIGLSIDSIHSHLAWVLNIKDTLGVELAFPMIADLDTNVAQKYGMIHPGESSTVTVRAVFVIDPNHKVRALIYYPLANGRNVDEVVRLVDSLQTADKHGVATPVNWQPGEKVVVPPNTTIADIQARLQKPFEHKNHYLAFKNL